MLRTLFSRSLFFSKKEKRKTEKKSLSLHEIVHTPSIKQTLKQKLQKKKNNEILGKIVHALKIKTSGTATNETSTRIKEYCANYSHNGTECENRTKRVNRKEWHFSNGKYE